MLHFFIIKTLIFQLVQFIPRLVCKANQAGYGGMGLVSVNFLKSVICIQVGRNKKKVNQESMLLS